MSRPAVVVLAFLSAAVAAGADSGPGAWLGIFLGDAIDGGVQVVAVVPGGPADRGGIRRGDVVLEFAGRGTPDRFVLGEMMDSAEPGAEVTLRVLRGGSIRDLHVRTGQVHSRVDPSPTVRSVPELAWGSWRASRDRLLGFLGARFAEIPEALRRHYGAPADRGILVISVDRDRAAERSGLRVGDVVIGAAGRPTSRPEDLAAALETAGAETPLTLEAVRAGRTVRVAIEGMRPSASREIEIERLRRENERLRRELERTRGGSR